MVMERENLHKGYRRRQQERSEEHARTDTNNRRLDE